MIPISLALYSPLVNGNGRDSRSNITSLFGPNWRRSIRRIGGFWIGTTDIDSTQVDKQWLAELFTYGLLTEIRESGGGQETWRGFLSKIDYVYHGMQYTMDVGPCANAIRSVYTRIFDNLITNGDCESGAWATYGSPTSVAQYSAWKTGGVYSMRIVAGHLIDGATVAAGVTIAAGVTYTVKGNLRVISGSWRFGIDTTAGAKVVSYSTHAVLGDHQINISIPSSNTYAGTVTVRITSEQATGEIWADDISMSEQSRSVNAGWQWDQSAIQTLGRKEDILIEAGMSDTAANAHIATQIRERAWPQTSSPPQYQTRIDTTPDVDKLSLTFTGYWAMLNWMYRRPVGTATITAHINNILSTFATQTGLDGLPSAPVLPGIIETNALSYSVDATQPLRQGDLLKEMVGTGDATAVNKWRLEVVEERKLNYQKITPTPQYRLRNNQAWYVGGSQVEPWLVRPGWVVNEDMPLGAYAGRNQEYDPRWEFIEEVEMKSDGTLQFNKEAL